eukprot:2266677-Rhodomonas_salina.17
MRFSPLSLSLPHSPSLSLTLLRYLSPSLPLSLSLPRSPALPLSPSLPLSLSLSPSPVRRDVRWYLPRVISETEGSYWYELLSCCAPPMRCSISCYAIPLRCAYHATQFLRNVSIMLHNSSSMLHNSYAIFLSCYAIPMRCCYMLQGPYTRSGTDTAYAAARRTGYAASTVPLLEVAILLCACYAMPGTHLARGTTRHPVLT